MDRVARKVASELLHGHGTGLVHIEHELYRVAHHQKGGLTEKEYKFLMARYEAIKAEREKVSKLTERLRTTCQM